MVRVASSRCLPCFDIIILAPLLSMSPLLCLLAYCTCASVLCTHCYLSTNCEPNRGNNTDPLRITLQQVHGLPCVSPTTKPQTPSGLPYLVQTLTPFPSGATVRDAYPVPHLQAGPPPQSKKLGCTTIAGLLHLSSLPAEPLRQSSALSLIWLLIGRLPLTTPM